MSSLGAKGFALDIPLFLRVLGVPEEAFTELFSWYLTTQESP
jgi:hypothetical protein